MAFSFVVENVDLFNWTESVFACTDTKKAFQPYVEETTKEHLDKWPLNESQHIKDFITHNLSGRDQRRLYKLRCKCINCTGIFKNLTEMKTFPDKPLQLQKPHEASQTWWLLLKMFLPEGSSNIKSLEECDIPLFLRLLGRCELFAGIETEKLNKIKTCRNKLMHSSSNEISIEQKEQYYDDLISLCTHPSFKDRREFHSILEKLSDPTDISCRFLSPLQEFEELRDALDIQKTAIERDIAECKNIKECQFDSADLEKLLKQVRENKATTTALIDVKGKLVGTLEEATAMGKEEGEKQFTGFVGKSIGKLTGGAGARVAGKFKMAIDP